MKRWTKREDLIIEKMAEYYPVELIQRRFRHLGYYRTVLSIKKRAEFLGISLRPTLDYISANQAASLFGVHQSTICRWVNKNLLPAMRRSPRHLAIKMEDMKNLITDPPTNWLKIKVSKISEDNRRYIFNDYE